VKNRHCARTEGIGLNARDLHRTFTVRKEKGMQKQVETAAEKSRKTKINGNVAEVNHRWRVNKDEPQNEHKVFLDFEGVTHDELLALAAQPMLGIVQGMMRAAASTGPIDPDQFVHHKVRELLDTRRGSKAKDSPEARKAKMIADARVAKLSASTIAAMIADFERQEREAAEAAELRELELEENELPSE
jgi:hypothetical protein